VNPKHYPASLQVNGGPILSNGKWSGFVAFDTPGLTLGQLEQVARYYYGLGYGYFCPTMVTASEEAYRSNLPVFLKARDYAWGQGILPPHLEGPFLAPECIGAHNPALRVDPTGRDRIEVQIPAPRQFQNSPHCGPRTVRSAVPR